MGTTSSQPRRPPPAPRQHLRRHLGPQRPLTPPAATEARPSGDRSRRPNGEPSPGHGHRAALEPRPGGIPGPAFAPSALSPGARPLLPLPASPRRPLSVLLRPGRRARSTASQPAPSTDAGSELGSLGWEEGRLRRGDRTSPAPNAYHVTSRREDFQGGRIWLSNVSGGDRARPVGSKLCCKLDVGGRHFSFFPFFFLIPGDSNIWNPLDERYY